MSGFSSSSSASFDCISHHNIQSYGFCLDFVLNLISKQYKFNQSAFFSEKKMKWKSGGNTKGLYFIKRSLEHVSHSLKSNGSHNSDDFFLWSAINKMK